MAETAEVYTLEQAATDLVEAPATSAPTIHDPGQIDSGTPAEHRSRGGLSVEQAADLMEDEPAPSGPAVAYHNGRPLTLQHLAHGFEEGTKLFELLQDVHLRYAEISHAGRSMWTAAHAIADFLAALVPPPSADLATTDPWEYQRRQVLYEQVESAALQVIRHAQTVARQNAEWANSKISTDNSAVELACFLEAFPQATSPEWVNQFYARIKDVAEHCGYHADELMTIKDYRAFKVLDLAAAALEKRKGSAKRPSTNRPAKPRLVSSNDDNLTISEAMNVDFD